MSDKQLDIQVVIEKREPGIRIGLEQKRPDIQIKMETGGSVFPTYDDETIIKPLPWSSRVLETSNKILKNNITILEIPYSSVSNLKDGRTVYIGE